MLWLSYIEGASEYFRLNRKETRRDEIMSMYISTVDEVNELVDAVKTGDIQEAFFELFDVLYCVVKMVYVIFLPMRLLESKWVWSPLFPLMYPVAVKYARRYQEYNCFRSKRNHGPDTHHRCNACFK